MINENKFSFSSSVIQIKLRHWLLSASFLAAVGFLPTELHAADLPLQNGDRIVFVGDSITDAKKWAHYLTSFLILSNPDKLLHIQTEARGGTTVAHYLASANTIPQYEQYSKMIIPYKPRYVFTMFGHNGSASPAEHRADYENLIDGFIASGHGLAEYSGALPILLGPHPKSTPDGKPILGAYEDELGALAALRGVRFSSTWHSLQPVWGISENRSLIVGADDDVHPGTAGHIAIAYTVAKNLGWNRDVSSAQVDKDLAKASNLANCMISNVSANEFGGLDFNRLDGRLPWAIDENGRNDANQLLPELKGWQKYMLTLNGLSSGIYDVLIDGVDVADVSNQEFALGWNMADLTIGPVWEQCQEVLGRIRDMHGVDRITLERLGPPWIGVEKYKSSVTFNYVNNGLRGQALIDSQTSNLESIAQLDQAIHSAAQPKIRSFSVRLKGATVMPPNEAPVAIAKSLTTAEDAPLSVVLGATDADDRALTYSVVASPTKGTLSGSPPNLSYSPLADFYGSDSFTFRANDGLLNSTTATISIAITPVNDAPVAYVKSISTPQNTSVAVSLDGSDKDTNILVYSIVSGPSNGTLVGSLQDFVYTPNKDFTGNDSFIFLVNDGVTESATVIQSITVNASTASLFTPPTGIPHPRWTENLHPIDVIKPALPVAWSGPSAQLFYYVDSSHPKATDTNNPNGRPDFPRISVPSTLAAGSRVFIASCQKAVVLKSAVGTAEQPIWLVGTDNATIRTAAVGKAIVISGSSAYVLIDGIVMDGSGAPDTSGSGGFAVVDGANHVCFRNCVVKNYIAPPYNPTRFSTGGAGAWYHSLNGISSDSGNVSDVVIYKLDCVGNAGGQNLDYESGRHAMHITGAVSGNYSTKNIWILNSILSDNSEDGIQVGQTSLNSIQTACSHIYIGGNVMSYNGENAVDLKSCDKVVVSRNVMSGYKSTAYRAGAVSGSDGSACVINDDGKGPLESWWLFNRFFECHGAIRNQAAGGKHYVVGNLAYQMQLDAGEAPTSGGYSRGTFYWQGVRGSDVYLVNNTVFDVEGGFYLHNVSSAYIWGNIVFGIRNNGVGYPVYINNSLSISVGENVYFDPDAPVRRDGNALSSENRDQIDVDPKLVAPPSNMELAASSPARGKATASLVYDTYKTTFGVSIRYDALGNAFPSGSAWHAGAVQGQSTTPAVKRPSGFRVIVK